MPKGGTPGRTWINARNNDLKNKETTGPVSLERDHRVACDDFADEYTAKFRENLRVSVRCSGDVEVEQARDNTDEIKEKLK